MNIAAQAQAAEEIFDVHSEDVEYLRVDGRPLLARLYIPQRRPVAGVVEAHGGQWRFGDRFNNKAIDESLARAGILVMALDFRQAPEAQYPAPIADIHFGIRWLKANAARFGLKREQIGALGTSSGGHQLLLAAMKPHDPRYAAHPDPAGAEGPLDAGVPWLVICWAVNDPLARYRMAREKQVERFLASHAAYWPSEAAMEEGNPRLVLERGEEVLTPPMLYIQGADDDNLTPDMAEKFVAAYRARGGEVTLKTFAGQPHMFVTQNPTTEASRQALKDMAAFIRARAGA